MQQPSTRPIARRSSLPNDLAQFPERGSDLGRGGADPADADTGTQTRILRFVESPPAGERTWQGQSVARWDAAARSLGVVTRNMRAGYLRWNGVPYSENATLTEHFDVAPHGDGGQLLVITTIVDDPQYLQRPFIVSSHFKRERDGSKWSPTPCSATW